MYRRGRPAELQPESRAGRCLGPTLHIEDEIEDEGQTVSSSKRCHAIADSFVSLAVRLGAYKLSEGEQYGTVDNLSRLRNLE